MWMNKVVVLKLNKPMTFKGHDLAAKEQPITSQRHALELVVGVRKTFVFASPLRMAYAPFLGVLKSLVVVKYIASLSKYLPSPNK